MTGLPAQFGVTSFPTDVCGYAAGQLRSAYGATARAAAAVSASRWWSSA